MTVTHDFVSNGIKDTVSYMLYKMTLIYTNCVIIHAIIAYDKQAPTSDMMICYNTITIEKKRVVL